MNKIYTFFMPIVFFVIPVYPKVSIPKISLPCKTFFLGNKKQDVFQKEFVNVKKIEFCANKGNLIVHTWKQKSIMLEIKKNGSAEQCHKTEINTCQDETLLQVEIKSEQEKTTAYCDIQLIVPEKTSLNIQLNTGDIIIKNLSGYIQAQTDHGDIIISDGDHEGIIRTHKGNIVLQKESINPDQILNAHTDSGNITLQVPQHINCNIFAHTKKGHIYSDLFITLQGQNTQLTDQFYKQQRQKLIGVIQKDRSNQGIGTVELSSLNGTIHIKPYV